MLPESYYEPDWFECDCDDHDKECSFCGEPEQHCECVDPD